MVSQGLPARKLLALRRNRHPVQVHAPQIWPAGVAIMLSSVQGDFPRNYPRRSGGWGCIVLHRGRQLQKMAEFSGFLQEDARACGSFWRSGPESNRHTRICSPLHHHSATGPQVAGQAGKTEGIRRLRPRRPYSTVVSGYPECPQKADWRSQRRSLSYPAGVRRCPVSKPG